MEVDIALSQFQQAILQLHMKLRKAGIVNVSEKMIEIIFGQDQYEIDEQCVQEIQAAFELDYETANIIQILYSSFEQSGFPEVEEYINLLLFRIDNGMCMMDQQSASSTSSPSNYFSQYTVNDYCIKKKIKKEKKTDKKNKK